MTRKISVINQKGGVGKTTTTITLASGLAKAGKKVLIIDLDPQGNIASSLWVKSEHTVYDMLIDGVSPHKCIVNVSNNFDVITSDSNLHKAEMILAGQPNREMVLKRVMQDFNSYDFIFLDCPPTLNLLNYNALIYSSEAFIPVATDYLGLEGLRKMTEVIEQVREIFEHDLRITAVIPTMFDRRSKISKQILEEMHKGFNGQVTSPIRMNTALKEAPRAGKSILDYRKWAPGAKDYQLIIEKIMQQDYYNPHS